MENKEIFKGYKKITVFQPEVSNQTSEIQLEQPGSNVKTTEDVEPEMPRAVYEPIRPIDISKDFGSWLEERQKAPNLEKNNKSEIFKRSFDTKWHQRDYLNCDNRYDFRFTFFKTFSIAGNGTEPIFYKSYQEDIPQIKYITENILLIIPKDWCDYMGYDIDFINDYIDRLNSFGFGEIKLSKVDSFEGHRLFKSLGERSPIINNTYYYFTVVSESEITKYYLCEFLTYLHVRNFNAVPGSFRQLSEELKKTNKSTISDMDLFLWSIIMTTADNDSFAFFSRYRFGLILGEAFYTIPFKNTASGMLGKILNNETYINMLCINNKDFKEFSNIFKNKKQFINKINSLVCQN